MTTEMRNKELAQRLSELVADIKGQPLSTVDLMESAKYLITEAILCEGKPDRLMAHVLIETCWTAIGERD